MQIIELNRRDDGKVRATEDQKRAVLDLLLQGHSLAEVARSHGLSIQTLVKWRRCDVKRVMSMQSSSSSLTAVPDDRKEILAEMRRLAEENQKLRKALGNISYDRDILQEAYNIAVKKKWI